MKTKINIKYSILFFITFFWVQTTLSQQLMKVNAESTVTIDGALDEMLRIINGKKGKERNWDAFKDLFLESVRFTVVYNDEAIETATLDEMIEFMQDDYYDSGYKEISLNRQIESFNGIAQVLEVVKHIEPDGNTAKGLNSYHLVFYNKRWWISNIIWTMETPTNKIPEKYSKN